MKKTLIILLTIISLFGCSDDDDTNYHFEYVPVLSADVPDEFIHGQHYELKVKYELPNSCYSYYSFEYLYDDTSRIITPIAIVNDDIVCDQSTHEGEFTVLVEARQFEPYIFNFWQGNDNQGDPIYLTIEVPVKLTN